MVIQVDPDIYEALWDDARAMRILTGEEVAECIIDNYYRELREKYDKSKAG